VIDAAEFAYDGCHKIYLIFTAADRAAIFAAYADGIATGEAEAEADNDEKNLIFAV